MIMLKVKFEESSFICGLKTVFRAIGDLSLGEAGHNAKIIPIILTMCLSSRFPKSSTAAGKLAIWLSLIKKSLVSHDKAAFFSYQSIL